MVLVVAGLLVGPGGVSIMRDGARSTSPVILVEVADALVEEKLAGEALRGPRRHGPEDLRRELEPEWGGRPADVADPARVGVELLEGMDQRGRVAGELHRDPVSCSTPWSRNAQTWSDSANRRGTTPRMALRKLSSLGSSSAEIALP